LFKGTPFTKEDIKGKPVAGVFSAPVKTLKVLLSLGEILCIRIPHVRAKEFSRPPKFLSNVEVLKKATKGNILKGNYF